MKIITFANHKGGVGKTTSTLNVAQTLVRDGHRVLLVDCDAQGNLTQSLRLPATYPDLGLVLSKKATLAEVVVPLNDNLSLVAATAELDFLEKVLAQQFGYEHILRTGLESLRSQFDYCLLDTPPRLSALTYAALVASDRVFIPCQPEFYGYTGLTNLLDACARVSEHFNPQLRQRIQAENDQKLYGTRLPIAPVSLPTPATTAPLASEGSGVGEGIVGDRWIPFGTYLHDQVYLTLKQAEFWEPGFEIRKFVNKVLSTALAELPNSQQPLPDEQLAAVLKKINRTKS
nr:hypothetical protein [Tanacetum cinerariifolium]